MRDDDGSATILVLAGGALLSTFAVLVGLLATGLTAHRQALRAADLAALAGAQRSLTDATIACESADVTARANGAELEECRLDEGTLRVLVRVPTSGWLPAVVAASRAGPDVS